MASIDSWNATVPSSTLDPGGACCPMCGSQALSRFSARAFDGADGARVSVVECDACAFGWQFPLGRSVDESADYFTEAYQSADTQPGSYFDTDVKSQVARLETEFIASLPAPGRRLLDVGAGSGLFARAADAADWQVTAVDPAIDPEGLADTGVRALRGTTDALADDERFDVITLWDVIEHLDDPVPVIESLTRRLRPGGWLVVETGNYKSADRVLGGAEHWIYQLDHRWYFAPDSVQQLLAQMGLRDFRFADRVLRPRWNGSSAYRAPAGLRLMRDLLRRPAQAAASWRRHAQLRRASGWTLAGLPIFCLAARMP